jgi:hypothetical protein
MNLYEAFETNLDDTAKEFPLSDTAAITLLPIGGEKAKRAFDRMMEPYSPRLNAGGKLTEEENKSLNARFYAETIVKGWKGIKDREGKLIKYTPEVCQGPVRGPEARQLLRADRPHGGE